MSALDDLLTQYAPPAAPPSPTVTSAPSSALDALTQQYTPRPEQVQKFTALGPLNAPLNAVQGFQEQLGRAATFGLQDKVGALVPAVNNSVASLFGGGNGQSFGQNYQTELANQRGAGDTYAANHPVASKVATTVGTAASLAPSTVPDGMTWLGQVYRGAAGRFVAGAAPAGAVAIPKTIADMATQGVVAGGLGAFGSTNDQSLSQDAKDTAAGATLGAGIGGTLGASAPYLSKGVNALLNSSLAHRVEGPGALIAGLEALHTGDWRALAAGATGLAALHGMSNVPTRVWQGLLPLLARQAGSAAPTLMSQNQGSQ